MTIATKTQSGVAVTLTGVKQDSGPTVEVRFSHPTLGAVRFTSNTYGTMRGVAGILGWHGSGKLCVTVPRTDFDSALAEAKALDQRELEALEAGTLPIELVWSEGEYLSGWAVQSPEVARKILAQLELANPVQGWGHLVVSELVEACGQSFTLAQAKEFARPRLERKDRLDEATRVSRVSRQLWRDGCLGEARKAGRPVEIQRWTEPCSEKDYECDVDIRKEMAHPDGTVTIERVHTH